MNDLEIKLMQASFEQNMPVIICLYNNYPNQYFHSLLCYIAK